MKLLLDENLSPRVAQLLRAEDGVDAVHVEERGMLGASDEEVFAKAFAEDRVLVTLNVRDFVKLARMSELHAGVVLFEKASMLRDEQLTVLRAAVKGIAGHDMANRAVWVAADGNLTFEEIP